VSFWILLQIPRLPALIRDSLCLVLESTSPKRLRVTRKKAAGCEPATWGSRGLLPNAVCTFTGIVRHRLDFNAVLLTRGRDEAPDAVRLPGVHDLGERGTLGAGDHLQDLRALALGAGEGGLAFAIAGLLAGLPARFGSFLRRSGLGFGSLLGTVGSFGWGLLRRVVRALCGNGGGFVSSVGFRGYHVPGYLFLRLVGADD
jgi:hypothetical protein